MLLALGLQTISAWEETTPALPWWLLIKHGGAPYA